jgi:hypothetical protein
MHQGMVGGLPSGLSFGKGNTIMNPSFIKELQAIVGEPYTLSDRESLAVVLGWCCCLGLPMK